MSDDGTADLLLKADALMRRSRSYVASQGSAPPQALPQVEEALAEPDPASDDDIPVLTEKLSDSEATRATAPPHMQRHLDALREELALWLERELPQAVLKVTDGLADQLVGELTHQAEKELLPRLIARLDGSTSDPE